MVRLDSPDLVGDIKNRGDRTTWPPPPGQAAQEGTWQGGARDYPSASPAGRPVAGALLERRGDLSGTHPTLTPHDPYAGKRGRDLKASWDWLAFAAGLPADPVPIPLSASNQLIETGRQILLGGSLINTGSGSAQSVVTPANPAAGANFTYTNTSGVPQVLEALKALFTASASAGSRFLQWQILDASSNVLAYGINTAAVVASTSCTVDAAIGNSYQASATGTWQSPLPAGLVIPPGGFVTLITTILAGDQWSAIVLTFGQLGGSGYAEVRDGMDATGGLIARVVVPAGGAASLQLPSYGVLCETGLYLVVSQATISGSLWVTHLWKYPFTPPGE